MTQQYLFHQILWDQPYFSLSSLTMTLGYAATLDAGLCGERIFYSRCNAPLKHIYTYTYWHAYELYIRVCVRPSWCVLNACALASHHTQWFMAAERIWCNLWLSKFLFCIKLFSTRRDGDEGCLPFKEFHKRWARRRVFAWRLCVCDFLIMRIFALLLMLLTLSAFSARGFPFTMRPDCKNAKTFIGYAANVRGGVVVADCYLWLFNFLLFRQQQQQWKIKKESL